MASYLVSCRVGTINGKSPRYQRKYCDVHTLLYVTNTNV
jgi:hypothetical protein